MSKSYRVQLTCPHLDHAEWLVMKDLHLSLVGVLNTSWEFDCPVHGRQSEKPLQAEERRESLETISCGAEGCGNNSIGLLDGSAFCQNHFILTCRVQLEAYHRRWRERRWREMTLESVSRFIYSAMREAIRIEQGTKNLDNVQRAEILKIVASASDLGRRIRRSPRKALAIPLQLISEEPNHTWHEQTETVILSRCGALVRSEHSVKINQDLKVLRNDDRQHASARVAWYPPERNTHPVLAIEFRECRNFWGLDWNVVEINA